MGDTRCAVCGGEVNLPDPDDYKLAIVHTRCANQDVPTAIRNLIAQWRQEADELDSDEGVGSKSEAARARGDADALEKAIYEIAGGQNGA